MADDASHSPNATPHRYNLRRRDSYATPSNSQSTRTTRRRRAIALNVEVDTQVVNPSHISTLRKKELIQECRERGLDVNGTKDVLIARIREHAHTHNEGAPSNTNTGVSVQTPLRRSQRLSSTQKPLDSVDIEPSTPNSNTTRAQRPATGRRRGLPPARTPAVRTLPRRAAASRAAAALGNENANTLDTAMTQEVQPPPTARVLVMESTEPSANLSHVTDSVRQTVLSRSSRQVEELSETGSVTRSMTRTGGNSQVLLEERPYSGTEANALTGTSVDTRPKSGRSEKYGATNLDSGDQFVERTQDKSSPSRRTRASKLESQNADVHLTDRHLECESRHSDIDLMDTENKIPDSRNLVSSFTRPKKSNEDEKKICKPSALRNSVSPANSGEVWDLLQSQNVASNKVSPLPASKREIADESIGKYSDMKSAMDTPLNRAGAPSLVKDVEALVSKTPSKYFNFSVTYGTPNPKTAPESFRMHSSVVSRGDAQTQPLDKESGLLSAENPDISKTSAPERNPALNPLSTKDQEKFEAPQDIVRRDESPESGRRVEDGGGKGAACNIVCDTEGNHDSEGGQVLEARACKATRYESEDPQDSTFDVHTEKTDGADANLVDAEQLEDIARLSSELETNSQKSSEREASLRQSKHRPSDISQDNFVSKVAIDGDKSELDSPDLGSVEDGVHDSNTPADLKASLLEPKTFSYGSLDCVPAEEGASGEQARGTMGATELEPNCVREPELGLATASSRGPVANTITVPVGSEDPKNVHVSEVESKIFIVSNVNRAIGASLHVDTKMERSASEKDDSMAGSNQQALEPDVEVTSQASLAASDPMDVDNENEDVIESSELIENDPVPKSSNSGVLENTDCESKGVVPDDVEDTSGSHEQLLVTELTKHASKRDEWEDEERGGSPSNGLHPNELSSNVLELEIDGETRIDPPEPEECPSEIQELDSLEAGILSDTPVPDESESLESEVAAERHEDNDLEANESSALLDGHPDGSGPDAESSPRHCDSVEAVEEMGTYAGEGTCIEIDSKSEENDDDDVNSNQSVETGGAHDQHPAKENEASVSLGTYLQENGVLETVYERTNGPSTDEMGNAEEVAISEGDVVENCRFRSEIGPPFPNLKKPDSERVTSVGQAPILSSLERTDVSDIQSSRSNDRVDQSNIAGVKRGREYETDHSRKTEANESREYSNSDRSKRRRMADIVTQLQYNMPTPDDTIEKIVFGDRELDQSGIEKAVMSSTSQCVEDQRRSKLLERLSKIENATMQSGLFTRDDLEKRENAGFSVDAGAGAVFNIGSRYVDRSKLRPVSAPTSRKMGFPRASIRPRRLLARSVWDSKKLAHLSSQRATQFSEELNAWRQTDQYRGSLSGVQGISTIVDNIPTRKHLRWGKF